MAFGGTEIVSAGGTETIGLTNLPGDASAAGTVVVGSAGIVGVLSGGTGFGIDVHASGGALVLGTVSNTKVESDGDLVVASGGTAVASIVNAGGQEQIMPAQWPAAIR